MVFENDEDLKRFFYEIVCDFFREYSVQFAGIFVEENYVCDLWALKLVYASNHENHVWIVWTVDCIKMDWLQN